MHENFLIAIARGRSLELAKKHLIEEVDAEAGAKKKAIEADFADASIVAAGLRADEGSVAKKVAEAFLEDAMRAAEIEK